MQTLTRTVMKLVEGNNVVIKKIDSRDIKTTTKNLMTGELMSKEEPLKKYSTSMIGYQHQLELLGYEEVNI